MCKKKQILPVKILSSNILEEKKESVVIQTLLSYGQSNITTHDLCHDLGGGEEEADVQQTVSGNESTDTGFKGA